jgi:hypothetical protein
VPGLSDCDWDADCDCEGDWDADGDCEAVCEPDCEAVCEPVCDGDWDGVCEEVCEPDCEAVCEPVCDGDWDGVCEAVCEPDCEAVCEPVCDGDWDGVCEAVCEPDCEAVCEPDCEAVCEEEKEAAWEPDWVWESDLDGVADWLADTDWLGLPQVVCVDAMRSMRAHSRLPKDTERRERASDAEAAVVEGTRTVRFTRPVKPELRRRGESEPVTSDGVRAAEYVKPDAPESVAGPSAVGTETTTSTRSVPVESTAAAQAAAGGGGALHVSSVLLTERSGQGLPPTVTALTPGRSEKPEPAMERVTPPSALPCCGLTLVAVSGYEKVTGAEYVARPRGGLMTPPPETSTPMTYVPAWAGGMLHEREVVVAAVTLHATVSLSQIVSRRHTGTSAPPGARPAPADTA